MENVVTYKGRAMHNLPVVRWLVNNPRAAWLWLPLRIWLGYQWFGAGLEKVGNPAWVKTGDALMGYWTRAVTLPEGGRPPIAFDWYRAFIQGLLDAQAYTWFAKLVAYGELLVGIALILGIFTGAAALIGGFMNWNFIMAGSASTNGLLLILSVALLAAWKVSGLIGADYFLLRWLGFGWEDAPACQCGSEECAETHHMPEMQPAGI